MCAWRGDRVLAFTPKKRKILEAAQKYAQKGQYDKALREYEKLLKADPSDANLRLKIGDLQLKKGDREKAIGAYKQVAEGFSKGGFDAKAVAIYKQVLKVDESNLDARIALGDHFQRMGLKSDALREFQAAVEICQQRDMKREAFDLLKRVASLDPGNVSNRLHLADLLHREGLDDEARQEYASLLGELEGQTVADQVVRVGEQALQSFPDHRQALLALVGAKVSLGEARDAVEILQRSADRFSGDVEVLEARVNACEAASDGENLRQAWSELAEVYKKRGDVDKARDILQRHCSLETLGGDESTAPSILLTDATGGGGDLDLDPDPGFDVEPAADLDDELDLSGVAVSTMSVDDILSEARVSYEFGDPLEARKLVKQVLSREPGHAGALELLEQIKSGPGKRGARGAGPGPVESPPEIELEDSLEIDVNTADVEALTAGAADADPLGPAGPSIVARPAPELEPDPNGQSLPDIEILLEDEEDSDDVFASVDPPPELGSAPGQDSDDIEIEIELGDSLERELAAPDAEPQGESSTGAWGTDSTRIVENLDEAEFFLQQGLTEEAERLYRQILELAPNHPQAMVRLGEIERDRGAPEEEPVSAPATAPASAGEAAALPDDLLEIPEVELTASAVPAAGEDLAAADLDLDELELELELEDPGEPELDVIVEAADPAGADVDDELDLAGLESAEFDGALVELGESAPEIEAEVLAEDTRPTLMPAPGEPAPDDDPAADGLDLGDLDLHDLDLDLDLDADAGLDDASGVIEAEAVDDDAPGIEAEAIALDLDGDDDDPAGADDADGDVFDLAAELEEELEAGGETDPGQSGHGFDEVFSAFKKGIQEQLTSEDADAHYDLAIAYKEMDLLEDAIRELESVQQTGARLIETLSLMASCKLELGRPQEAVTDLKGALQLVSDTDSEISLRYELGEALVAAGKPGAGLEAFRKVAAAEPDHRDVQERIAELS